MNVLKKITIASSLQNLLIVQRFIEELCEEYNINNTIFGNISVAVTEAVKNAITHGNKENNTKNVDIKFGKDNKSFIFIIHDQGNGFDYNNLPDPTDINQENTSGRGLYLIKSLSDKVEFLDGGKTIKIKFDLCNINQIIIENRKQALDEYHQVSKQHPVSKS
jgi:serine/threonine-protein kinase RsbW